MDTSDNDYKSNWYTPTWSSQSYWDGKQGEANIHYQKWWTNRAEWLVNYTWTIPQHEIKFVGGYSWERSSWEQTYEYNENFTYDTTSYHGIGSGTGLKDGTANLYAGRSESTLIGFFGRVNYNWRDMLYASVSLRHEGSSKFGTNKKWGNFPAVSLAWEVTETPGLEIMVSVSAIAYCSQNKKCVSLHLKYKDERYV